MHTLHTSARPPGLEPGTHKLEERLATICAGSNPSMTNGPPKTTDAAVQTTASGECGFTLPSQPAKVVHGTQAYHNELIEVVEIIPTELRHQLSKSNLKRQIGDVYEYTSLAYRASKTRKVPPLPPPRCRYGFPPGVRMAPGFPPNTTWYRSA